MPILGATDIAALSRPRRPALLGQLWKGSEKQVNAKGNSIFGKDLSWFRFTSPDPAVVDMFHRMIGKEPARLRVYLPFQTVEQVFPTWIEGYDQKGKMLFQSDGEQTVGRRIGTVWSVRESDQISFAQATKGLDEKQIRWVGRLYVIVPELASEGLLGAVLLKTHSKYDCINLAAALHAYFAEHGDLRGVEWTLWRSAERIKSPTGHDVVKNLVRISPSSMWLVSPSLIVPTSEPSEAEDIEEDEWEESAVEDETAPVSGFSAPAPAPVPAPRPTQAETTATDTPSDFTTIWTRIRAGEFGYTSVQHAQNVYKKHAAGKTPAEVWAVLREHSPKSKTDLTIDSAQVVAVINAEIARLSVAYPSAWSDNPHPFQTAKAVLENQGFVLEKLTPDRLAALPTILEEWSKEIVDLKADGSGETPPPF